MVELKDIGVTKTKEGQFNKKGIYSAEDLVRYLPKEYKDYSHETGILPESENSVIIARYVRVDYYNSGSIDTVKLLVDYRGLNITAIWFNQPYKYHELQALNGKDLLLIGKIKYNEAYDSWNMSSPFLCTDAIQENLRIFPIYKKIPRMSQDYLVSHIQKAMDNPDCLRETCSLSIIQEQGLMPMAEALQTLHSPKSMESLERALYRIRFDDLLYFALRMELSARDMQSNSPYTFPSDHVFRQLYDSLPYKLTSDQQTVVQEMTAHIRSGKRLNALLQGDVGCGKTIVAILMMAAAVSNGAQAAIMAPTRQLAQQHYQDVVDLFSPLGVTVAFMGDSKMRVAEKRKLMAGIADGSIQVVVGTHSLLSAEFQNLGLCVIDEEHKFGVMQRKALSDRAGQGVHCLTMSATPIPRSLAQSLYGDTVQVYSILTLPAGRKPIRTIAINDPARLLNFVRYQHRTGHQTYVVCSAIEASDKEAMQSVVSVEQAADWLSAGLAGDGIRVACLTGKTKKEESENILAQFRSNQIHVLVATSVIEVGINIPSATGILIMNSERFGLASLHQLRGRVGRSNDQGYCVLQGATEGNPRTDALLSTTNGFKIAEADLAIRGPGDFLGTQQSGNDKYVSLMLSYPDTYKLVQQVARNTIDNHLSYPLYSKAQSDYQSEQEALKD